MKETKFMVELHKIREKMSKMSTKEKEDFHKAIKEKYKDLIE